MSSTTVRVAAVADIHAPKNLEAFKRALERMEKPDLFLLAGDIVLKGDFNQLPRVVEEIRRVHSGEIIACFGNEEYDEVEGALRSFGEVKWLSDQAEVFEIRGRTVGIVGSRGSLDRLTAWQRGHRPELSEVYRERVRLLDELLGGLRTDFKIVLTHYAPTYTTLEGEGKWAWPEMACRRMEDVIRRRQPDVWFHGHAHQSRRLEAEIGRTLVTNVSLPARGSITVVELPRKTGLEKFL